MRLETGSKSCVYTAPPPLVDLDWRVAPGLLRETPMRALRAVCHLSGGHAVSGRRPGGRRACSSASGTRSSSREEQTCCGQMHLNSGYAEEGRRAGAAARARVRGATRRWSAPPPPAPGWCAKSSGGGPPVHELSELVVDVLEPRGRGRVLPPPRDLPPDLPLAAHAAGGRAAASGCCGRWAASTSWSCPRPRSAADSAGRSRSRTRTCRRRCCRTSCARCSTRAPRWCARLDSSCLMHIGGGLSRGRTGVRTVHLAEILAATVRSAGR